MDLYEAQRRSAVRTALEASRAEMSAELGVELRVASDGNDLVLADAEGVRYRASLNPRGRLVLTAARAASLL